MQTYTDIPAVTSPINPNLFTHSLLLSYLCLHTGICYTHLPNHLEIPRSGLHALQYRSITKWNGPINATACLSLPELSAVIQQSLLHSDTETYGQKPDWYPKLFCCHLIIVILHLTFGETPQWTQHNSTHYCNLVILKQYSWTLDDPDSFYGDTTNKMPFYGDFTFRLRERERERERRFKNWNPTN